MPLDIMDALDSYLSAKARVQTWKDEFEKGFYAPFTNALPNVLMKVVKEHPMIDQERLRQGLSQKALDKLDGK